MLNTPTYKKYEKAKWLREHKEKWSEVTRRTAVTPNEFYDYFQLVGVPKKVLNSEPTHKCKFSTCRRQVPMTVEKCYLHAKPKS